MIPAQGAALVDALLERQREKDSIEASVIASANINLNQMNLGGGGDGPSQSIHNPNGDGSLPPVNGASVATRLRSPQNNAANSNGRLTLETAFLCPACGACMHWSSAKFCWQCGREFPRMEVVPQSPKLEDTEWSTANGEKSKPSQSGRSSLLSLGEEPERAAVASNVSTE